MFERILYAVERRDDGPPRSLTIVRVMALHHDSEVFVLRVGEIQEDQLALARKHDPDIESASEDARISAGVEGHLATIDVAQALREAGVFARTVSRTGRIAKEVLAVAEELDVDLIVVGSARHSTLGALLTGSITAEIVRQARRPVLVVPPDDTADLDDGSESPEESGP